MKKIISILLSVLMIVTIGIINPDIVNANDGNKYEYNLVSINQSEEVVLDDNSSIIGQLQNQFDTLFPNIEGFNKNSIKYLYAYKTNGSDKESLSILNENDTINSIISSGKSEIKFFSYFTSFTSNSLYYLNVNENEPTTTPTFERLYDTDVAIFNNFNENIDTNRNINIAFFYDTGGHTNPVEINFNDISNYGIKVEKANGYSTNNINNIYHVDIESSTDGEDPKECFSYDTKTIFVNVHGNNQEQQHEEDEYIYIQYVNGSNENSVSPLKKPANDVNLLSYLTENINDNTFTNPVFTYYNQDGKHVIDNNTTLEQLNDNLINVTWMNLKQESLYAKGLTWESGSEAISDVINTKIDIDSFSSQKFVFYFGTGTENDQLIKNIGPSSDDEDKLFISPPANFDSFPDKTLYVNTYKVVKPNAKLVSTINEQEYSIDVDIHLPYIAIYNQNEKNPNNLISQISKNDEDVYIIIDEENDYRFNETVNVKLGQIINNNFIDLNDESDVYTFQKDNDTKELKITINNFPDNLEDNNVTYILYNVNDKNICQGNIRFEQQQSQEEVIYSEYNKNNPYIVNTVEQLKTAINQMSNMHGGYIKIVANENQNNFVIDEKIEINHKYPITDGTSGIIDPEDPTYNDWLKIELDCDVVLSEDGEIEIPQGIGDRNINKVVFIGKNHSITNTETSKNVISSHNGQIVVNQLKINNTNGTAVCVRAGDIVMDEGSSFKGSTAIEVLPNTVNDGAASMHLLGKVIGTQYAINIHNEQGTNNLANYMIQANGLVSAGEGGVAVNIAGGCDDEELQLSNVEGQIKISNGTLKIDGTITSKYDCIVIDSESIDNANIFVQIGADEYSQVSLNSTNGNCISEIGTTSKINQLTIKSGKFKCGPNKETIELIKNSDNINITGGKYSKAHTYNAPFTSFATNVDEEGYYELKDSSKEPFEVNSYSGLIDAIGAKHKNIKLNTNLTTDTNVVINVPYDCSIDLMDHTITGYTFEFNAPDIIGGINDPSYLENGTIICKNNYGIIADSYLNIFDLNVSFADGYDGYLMDITGHGQVMGSDCTFEGNKGIKISLNYNYQRRLLDVQFNNVSIHTIENCIDDNCATNTNRMYNFTAHNNCRFVSDNGTALNLNRIEAPLNESYIEGNIGIVTNAHLSLHEGCQVKARHNGNTEITDEENNTRAAIVYLGSMLEIFDCDIQSDYDSAILIPNNINGNDIQATIYSGKFLSSKNVIKNLCNNLSPACDFHVVSGRYSSDMPYNMSMFRLTDGYQCITIDESERPYAIVKAYAENNNIKPYLYSEEDGVEIDGNALSEALTHAETGTVLVLNATKETNNKKISDIEGFKGNAVILGDCIDLHIVKKTKENNKDKFDEIHNANSIQKVTYPISNEIIELMRKNNGSIVLYHRDESEGQPSVKSYLIKSFAEGEAYNGECAYLSQDGQNIIIKTKTFSAFAIGVDLSGSLGITAKPMAIAGLKYDGTEKNLITAGSITSGSIVYSLSEFGEYSDTVPTGTNAGEYTVYYNICNADGQVIATDSIIATIEKADSSYINLPTGVGVLNYTGEAQPLVNAGSSNTGTILYKVGSCEYSQEIPTATEKGLYKIYYKLQGDANHKDIEECEIPIEVRIDKLQHVIVAPVKENLVYTGESLKLVSSGQCTTGKILFSLDGNSYSEAIPEGINVGTYTVYYKVDGDDNYEAIGPTTIEVTIAKQKINKPTVNTLAFAYDGEAHSLEIIQNDLYSIVDNELTDVGSIIVKVNLKDTNNYCWSDESITQLEFTLTVNPKVVTAPQANNSVFIYSGQEQKYFASENEDYDLTNNAKTGAGTYTVKASLKDKDNTVWSTGGVEDKEFEFVINKQKISHPAKDTTLFTYDGNEKTYTIAYSDLYTVSGNAKTNAGEYTVIVELTDPLNYEWSDGTTENKEYSFVINKASGSGSVSIENWTYDETESEPVPVSNTNGTSNVTYTYYDSQKQEITKPSKFNAGIYYQKAKFAATSNYNEYITDYVEFSVNKAQGSITTAPTAKTNLVYSGQDIELITAGSSTTGEIQYSLDGTNYLTNIPTGKNAGNYTVYYKVVGDANHEDVASASISVTINKKKIAVPVADNSEHIYKGEIYTYPVVSNDYYTVTNNTRIEVGVSDVIITLKDTNNTEWAEVLGEYKLIVVKANPTYSVPADIKAAKGSNLSSVILPKYFTWQEPNSVVNTDGNYKAKFTPVDINNFNVINDINIYVDVIDEATITITPESATTINSDTLSSLKSQVEEIKQATSYAGLTDAQLQIVKNAESVSINTKVEKVLATTEESIKINDAKNDNANILSYINIDLTLVADTNAYPLNETTNELEFTVKIDDTLVNDVPSGIDRLFYVLRNHEGIVERLDAEVDELGNLTFKSKLFSTYAIVYEDVIRQNGGGNNTSNPTKKVRIPKTGVD